jgi:hypothetical protein
MPKYSVVSECDDCHSDLFGSEYPSLQLSTDSDEEDFNEEATANNSSTCSPEDSAETGRKNATSASISKEVLASVAKLHFQDRVNRENLPFDIAEARSSLSSPGKIKDTLREKLRRLSRRKRKDLLIRKAGNPLKADESNNSILEDQEATSSPKRGAFSRVRVDSDDDSHIIMKRKTRYNSRGSIPQQRQSNRISIHIYDLIAKDTLMQLPWGYICEIGECFNEMNTALHELGTGAYHVGVEVNNVEYAFGATNIPGKTGVFSCIPRLSPGYQYRTSINFGDVPLIRKSWKSVPRADKSGSVYTAMAEHVYGRQVIKEMIPEYFGVDYDILRKNCCTFARDVCIRLGIKDDEVPSWFGNLAQSGAITQDIAYTTFEPLRMVLSTCEDTYEEVAALAQPDVKGFEVIPRPSSSGGKDMMLVVDAKRHASVDALRSKGIRRTTTWSY